MPSTTMIIFDNSLYMQNQDYLPSRLHLAKSSTHSIISTILRNTENCVGVAPLSQPEHNYIITPTNNISYINLFMARLKLDGNFKLREVFIRSKMALMNRPESDKRMIVLFGSDFSKHEFDEVIFDLVRSLKEASDLKIFVSVILFGEHAEIIREIITCEVEGEVIVINSNEDFETKALKMMGMEEFNEDEDPELALALKLSLEESGRPAAE